MANSSCDTFFSLDKSLQRLSTRSRKQKLWQIQLPEKFAVTMKACLCATACLCLLILMEAKADRLDWLCGQVIAHYDSLRAAGKMRNVIAASALTGNFSGATVHSIEDPPRCSENLPLIMGTLGRAYTKGFHRCRTVHIKLPC